ncbi:MAG: PQQ-binding-like beta-propeller repeat protein [Candidatus Marinimicrobia bacterium]|nr:PQQ-binding-like beta-propeller repeat protein [Candidatus Neomarinimicrobiota bacterium]
MADTLWTKTYGGTDIDAAYAIIQTLDGELAILAETGSYGEGSYDIWFLKTNKNGDILWTELFGGEGFDVCASLVQANDDGYVILGYTNSYGVGSLDIWLIKIDENGNFLWSKTFGGSSSEYASSIINILGGYAVLGWTSSYGSGYSDIWFLILNKSVEKPKSLTSVSGNGKAFLFWDECKDSSVIQCNIYRDTTLSSSTLIDSITGTPFPKTYVDTTVENYNTYYYKIKFVNNYGHESPFSNTVVVSPNLFSTKTKFTTSGAIQAGITMLYNNTLYAPSSGDKVYRYDTTGTVMYSLNVNGNIKSSSTITSDHNVYIASTDYNLYSFNASGVSNSGWPKALGSEATASVAVDVSGNCYIGTENGIFQCIASSGDMNWSFNVGAAVYASAAISADNTLYVVNANGKVYAFNLNTLDPSSISPNWLYEIGESVSSSPALDLDGNLYITTEGGRIVKLHDNGSSAESIWDINTDQKYTASPVISSNGTLIIGGENNILYAVNTSDGNIVWQQTLNGKIKSTASLAEIGTEKDRLYVGDDSGILYAIYLEDGEYIWQYKTKSAIQCPILYANNHIYFGTIGGSIISVEDKFTTGAMEKQSSTPSPIWPTFQGNNQRTGAQMPTTSTVYPGDTNNDGTVDEFDVLPIGVYFLEEGPSRTDASSVWEGQDVTSWPGYPANYADCNGDGVVDEKDIIPVGINWGSTRATSIQKHMINPNDKQMLVKHKEAFETIYNSVDGIDSEPAKAIRQLLETTLEIIPKTITLLPCYPNPFNPSTEIRFSLPEEMSVTLKVYDINGRFIKTLINSSELDMGYHTVTFNGDLYPSGTYIYVLQTTESVNAQKMMLIK